MADEAAILLVEDDPSTRELLRRCLRRQGHETIAVGTLKDGLATLRSASPSVVVLDYRLPDGDCWSLLEAASELRTPVILLTGMGDENVAAEAVRRGASDYLVKRGDFLERLPGSLERVLRLARAEREVERLKRLQSNILASMPANVALLSRSGEIILVNEPWERFARENGMRVPRYGVGQNYLDFCPQKLASRIKDVLEGRKDSYTLEYACHAPGAKSWYRLVVSPVPEGPGAGAVVMHVDVTDRVLAQRSKQQSSHLLNNVLNSIEESILVLDGLGNVVLRNKAARRFGRDGSPEDWCSRFRPVDRNGLPVSPENLPGLRALKGQVVRDDELILSAGDEKIWLTVDASPLLEKEGELLGSVVTLKDITHRRSRETEIRRLAAALEQSTDAILVTDPAGQPEYANARYRRLSARSQEQFQALCSELMTDPGSPRRLTLEAGCGETFIADVTISAIRDEEGEIRSYVVALRDVTHSVELEAQLRQAQKMDAIGRLAGGIAHDFNNLLTVITGAGEFLLHQFSESPGVVEEARGILKASESAASLIRQLLTFSRSQVQNVEVLDLNRVIHGSTRMLKRLLGERVELHVDLKSDLWLVEADYGQLEQVVVNLSVNARDAMPKGGRLAFLSYNLEVDPSGDWELAPGRYVSLEVSDTGHGIPVEDLPRIFEPFFTRKSPTQGTGLGLATVYGIVKQSGGIIRAENRLDGGGATFQIFLPALPDEAKMPDAEKKPEKNESVGGSGECILVVEDNPQVSTLLLRVLGRAGYIVETLCTGDAPLEIPPQEFEKFSLIVSDVVLPRLTGPEMVKELRRRGVSTPVIFLSGYTDHENLSEGEMFLQKPFSPIALLNVVRQVLTSPARQKL